MNKTSIEWTDLSINPIRARKIDGSNRVPGHFCQKISPGCANCYSSRMQVRFGMSEFPGVTKAAEAIGEELFLDESVLTALLHRRKPAKVFWCDMTDMFGHWVPDEWIDKCLAVMSLTPHLTHQVLTKRPERMFKYFTQDEGFGRWGFIEHRARHMVDILPGKTLATYGGKNLPNVWLGTSIENQPTADERVTWLLRTPAAVRFLSCEPLLGGIDLHQTQGRDYCTCNVEASEGAGQHSQGCRIFDFPPGIHWVIVGGESGPGARVMRVEWAQSLRDQCVGAGIPLFFKQWGSWSHAEDVGRSDGQGHWCEHARSFRGPGEGVAYKRVQKKRAGRLLDGREWNEFPEVRA